MLYSSPSIDLLNKGCGDLLAIEVEFYRGPGHTCSESLWNTSGSHLTAGKIMHESDQLQ